MFLEQENDVSIEICTMIEEWLKQNNVDSLPDKFFKFLSYSVQNAISQMTLGE
jgi:hypothetical protein